MGRSVAIIALLAFSPLFLPGQTVVLDTTYAETQLQCLSAYVDFPDLTRYFSGLVVKQGRRAYYLDHPYTLEVLNNRIVFDDADRFSDKVNVFLTNTGYADMDEFKAAAIGCFPGSGGSPDFSIDSLSYWGDTLRLYVNGDPNPFSTYIDSCPCEEAPTELPCIYVLGDPATGQVLGNPETGQIIAVADCAAVSECAYVIGDPETGAVIGDPETGAVLFAQTCPIGASF